MTDNDFRPVLYLNQHCPFCLKLMIFLSEARLLGRFEVRKFVPGDETEQVIKAELAPHFEKVTFPAVQQSPGQYENGSDALIAHYAKQAAVDPSEMQLLNYYLGGVFKRVGDLYKENMALKAQAPV